MLIVSLFDESGNALRPWARNGHSCYAFDITNKWRIEHHQSGGFIVYVPSDLRTGGLRFILSLQPDFVMGFPPCTDMAVSGARHFKAKRSVNPNFQRDAADLARIVELVGVLCGCPWFAENPVSVLSKLWRKPNVIFDPFEYGGYLASDDVHPRWPEYIAPRDAYPKKTCIWSGGGFVIPARLPVDVREGWSDQQLKLGGKSAKTKQIRSEGPRGFLEAVYYANSKTPAT